MLGGSMFAWRWRRQAFLAPQIVHYKENPPFNTVLYRPPLWYDQPGAEANIAAVEKVLQDAKEAFFAAFKVFLTLA